jgi:hypothetical protein
MVRKLDDTYLINKDYINNDNLFGTVHSFHYENGTLRIMAKLSKSGLDSELKPFEILFEGVIAISARMILNPSEVYQIQELPPNEVLEIKNLTYSEKDNIGYIIKFDTNSSIHIISTRVILK